MNEHAIYEIVGTKKQRYNDRSNRELSILIAACLYLALL